MAKSMSKKEKSQLGADQKILTSFRAGHQLIFRRGRVERSLKDVAFIYRDETYDTGGHEALSLETGISAFGKTPDEAYKRLVILLMDALGACLDCSKKVAVGAPVSAKIRRLSNQGLRFPADRQAKCLEGTKKPFSKLHDEYTVTVRGTTKDLEDTWIGILAETK